MRAFNNKNIILLAQAKRYSTLDQFLLAGLSKSIRIACFLISRNYVQRG